MLKHGYSEEDSLNGGVQRLTLGGLFYTGIFSGFCQSFVWCPMELVKKRLMAQDHSRGCESQAKYRGMLHCATTVMKQQGVKGLYVGYPLVASMYVPACGVWYASYAYYRRLLNKDNEKSPSAAKTIFAGGMAGVTAWTLAYPFDTLAARVQTADADTYKGAFDIARKLYATEGVRGFYKGWLPCVLRAFPADGALFLVYELSMRLLRFMNQ